MESILHQILLAVATLAAAAITAAVTQAARSHGLTIDKQQEDALRSATRDAIDFAEEKAVSYLALNAGSLTSFEKLRLAIGFLKNRTGISTDEADARIHAALPSSDAGATQAIIPPYDPTKSGQS